MRTKTINKNITNSLTDLTAALGIEQNFGTQLSQTATLTKNNRNYFLSNDRTTLSYSYTTHGVVQTLIDQPVEDAFRGGIIIKSSQLDSDNIQEIQNYINENSILEEIKDLAKWSRLYGGGAMVINTIGDSNKPLNINQINKKAPLDFYAADLWELNKTNSQTFSENKPYVKTGIEDQFFFYGNELHKSRSIIAKGKRAPSFVRPQLRGWGMSEIERLVRSFNQYVKNQDLIFELLDEAKVDVYGIKGFNQSLMTKGGTEALEKRIRLANQTKNFQSAIVKDKEDDYEQKQLNFSGLSEMLQQIRVGIANDLKMPLTKIFGESTTGFSSGEDGLENYNSMIESEIRGKFDGICIQIIKLISQKLFEFVPDDLQIEYHPLRILSAEQYEVVKTSKMNNILALYDRGLINSKEVIEEINNQDILSVHLDGTILDKFPAPPPEKPKLDLTTNSIFNKIFKRK